MTIQSGAKATHFDKFAQFSRISRGRASYCLTLLSFAMTGCASSSLPTLNEPERLYSTNMEMDSIKGQLDVDTELVKIVSSNPTDDPDKFISLRIYAVDLAYSKYEAQLTHETEEANIPCFFGPNTS